MTAKKNTPAFQTKTSTQEEKIRSKWVKEVISELGPDFRIQYDITVDDLVGRVNNKFARHQNGNSAVFKSDGGHVFYEDKLFVLCEHKHQDTPKNACERSGRCYFYMHDHEIFISTSGDGFSEKTMTEHSVSTGKFLTALLHGHKHKDLEYGAGVSHNESEEEFKKTFRAFIEQRVLLSKHKIMLVPPHILAAGTVDGKFDWNQI